MSSLNSDGDDATCEFDSDYEYDSSTDDECHLEEVHSNEHALFNQEPVSCPICCEEGVEEGCALVLPSCSHSFCIECFTKYLEVQIGNGNADSIVCPFILDGADGHGKMGKQCNAPVEMEVLHEIMTQESYDKLMQQKDAAFVRKNVDYHHCPTPDCSNVVLCKRVVESDTKKDEKGSVDDEVARICDCFKCGNTSCLTCGARPFHTNKTCNEYREEQRQRRIHEHEQNLRWRIHQFGPSTDRSRADEEAKYDFHIKCGTEDNGNNNGSENICDTLLDGIKRCRRCGNGVELQSGCLKMKCICGYRFCYKCGSENAQCDCTPSHHGFTDNRTGMGDFSGLGESTSYT